MWRTRGDTLARGSKARRHAHRARGSDEIPASASINRNDRGDAAYEEKLSRAPPRRGDDANEERIRQKSALLGVKEDVDRELNRLGAHLAEVSAW